MPINGHHYVDGGLTNNLPHPYPDGATIRIQPFSTIPENAEISPILSYPTDSTARIIQKCPNQNFTMHLKRRNLDRAFLKALFPPDKDEKWYEDLFAEGVHDARLYLNKS